MGKSDAEEAAEESSEEAIRNTRAGIQELRSVRDRFELDDFVQTQGRALLNQILERPLTFDDQLKTSLASQIAGRTARDQRSAQLQAGQLAQRLGTGRSDAGGGGIATIAQLQNAAQNTAAIDQIERLAAQSRNQDLNAAIAAGFGFLNQLLGPSRDLALGQLGTLGGLSNLTSANAQLAQGQSGPLDFLGGLLGAGAGAFAGGAGEGLAGLLFD